MDSVARFWLELAGARRSMRSSTGRVSVGRLYPSMDLGESILRSAVLAAKGTPYCLEVTIAKVCILEWMAREADADRLTDESGVESFVQSEDFLSLVVMTDDRRPSLEVDGLGTFKFSMQGGDVQANLLHDDTNHYPVKARLKFTYTSPNDHVVRSCEGYATIPEPTKQPHECCTIM